MKLPAQKTDRKLLKLLEEVKKRPPMTREEREAQRKSWVIGEMMLGHPEMTREEAERLYQQVIG